MARDRLYLLKPDFQADGAKQFMLSFYPNNCDYLAATLGTGRPHK